MPKPFNAFVILFARHSGLLGWDRRRFRTRALLADLEPLELLGIDKGDVGLLLGSR